jgi:hypothetical protein
MGLVSAALAMGGFFWVPWTPAGRPATPWTPVTR